MSWDLGVGNWFSGGAKSTGRFAKGAWKGLFPEGGGDAQQGETQRPEIPGYIDENLQEQGQRLADLEAKKGNIEQALWATNYGAPAMRSLAKNLAKTRAAYAERGLVASGDVQAAMAGEAGKTSSQLADARSSINAEVENQIGSLRQAYLGGLEARRAMQQAASDDAFQKALSDWRAKQEIWSTLGSAGGQVGGAALAKAKSSG